MKDKEKAIDYWIKASKMDFEVMETLFNAGKYPQALFFLHLAVEKMIKALFVESQDEFPPKTHNLLYLIDRTGIKITDKFLKDLAEINTFQMEARYPDEKFSFYKKADKSFAEKYKKKGKEIIKWIEKKLKV